MVKFLIVLMLKWLRSTCLPPGLCSSTHWELLVFPPGLSSTSFILIEDGVFANEEMFWAGFARYCVIAVLLTPVLFDPGRTESFSEMAKPLFMEGETRRIPANK